MATDDRKAPRHAAKHAAPAAAQTTATPKRVRVSDRSNVDRQLGASSSRSASRMASERRLTGSNRPSYRRQAQQTTRSPLPLIAIALAALVVIVVGIFLVRGCVNSAATQPDEPEVEQQQVQTTADDSVVYQGVTFSIDESTSPAQVVFQEPEGGTSGTLFELEGDPAALILYDGTIVVPENLGGTWDLMAFVMGADSLPTKVVGADGNPVTGTGDIVEATLDGTVVRITDSNGGVTEVSLV